MSTKPVLGDVVLLRNEYWPYADRFPRMSRSVCLASRRVNIRPNNPYSARRLGGCLGSIDIREQVGHAAARARLLPVRSLARALLFSLSLMFSRLSGLVLSRPTCRVLRAARTFSAKHNESGHLANHQARSARLYNSTATGARSSYAEHRLPRNPLSWQRRLFRSRSSDLATTRARSLFAKLCLTPDSRVPPDRARDRVRELLSTDCRARGEYASRNVSLHPHARGVRRPLRARSIAQTYRIAACPSAGRYYNDDTHGAHTSTLIRRGHPAPTARRTLDQHRALTKGFPTRRSREATARVLAR